MSEELSPYKEINSIERNLSCDEKVMLSVYDLAKTLGVSPGETVAPLHPDEVDSAAIVYNEMRDPNRDYHGEDWESLPIAWESPYVPATADMAQKVREFLATCRGGSRIAAMTQKERRRH